MGRLTEEIAGTLSGAPHGGAHRRCVQAFWQSQNLGEAEFISAEHMQIQGLPLRFALWEVNVQNPTYITTVWGYGYKWGV